MVTDDSSAQTAQDEKSIYAALDGGTDGLRVTQIFIERLASKLSLNGCCYLVAIEQNDPEGKLADIARTNGLQSDIVLDRKAGIEHLYLKV